MTKDLVDALGIVNKYIDDCTDDLLNLNDQLLKEDSVHIEKSKKQMFAIGHKIATIEAALPGSKELLTKKMGTKSRAIMSYFDSHNFDKEKCPECRSKHE